MTTWPKTWALMGAIYLYSPERSARRLSVDVTAVPRPHWDSSVALAVRGRCCDRSISARPCQGPCAGLWCALDSVTSSVRGVTTSHG
ncbi:hypothetical protein J6590_039764 [Homalodisca vitripennis]|nr:hypothetical protein J6590_039764 [Homalodisca vitripennis]